MKSNIPSRIPKILNSVSTVAAICLFSLFTPNNAGADGNVPEEVKKTPFATSADLRILKQKLEACEDSVKYHEGTKNSWDSVVKSVQGQEREEKGFLAAQKNRIKILKTKVKENQRILSRGKYKNGDSLTSDGRTKLERANKETLRELKRAEINLERGNKRLESHKNHIRSTKSELKELRSKLRTLRASCARVRTQIKKASS